jgi:hypothetical protein
MRSRPVVFDPERGVVVDIGMTIPDDLPLGSRNFLNVSHPPPNLKSMEADICTRQVGEMTLLRDQKRGIDRIPYPTPINYIQADFASVPVMDRPYIGVVDLSQLP